MTKLSGLVPQTGDVIVCYYPTVQDRVLHFTVYLEPRDSPSTAAAYAHSMDKGVVIEPFAGYAEMPGFLHARCTDEAVRGAAAQAAKTWATTEKTTPYGSFPRGQDFKTAQVRANRFSGMRATARVGDIPFEMAALVRLMKWTLRLKEKAALSETRGITCAAFVAACHQAAAMQRFLKNNGALEKLDKTSFGQINSLLESKTDLRSRLQLTEAEVNPGVDLKKPIYVGQALRENSNRGLAKGVADKLQNRLGKLEGKTDEYPNFFDTPYTLKTIPQVELAWLVLQVTTFGLSSYVAQPLVSIIPPDFYYDAKYINSIILTEIIKNSQAWAKTHCAEY